MEISEKEISSIKTNDVSDNNDRKNLDPYLAGNQLEENQPK